MAIYTVTHEIKVKISPKRLFKALVTDAHNVLHQVASAAIKSIDVLKGHGGDVGSIRQINFPDGAPFPYMKDELAAVDTENLTCKFVIHEGPVLGDKLESIQSVHQFIDSGDGGCIVKIVTEHHTKGDAHFDEEDVKSSKENGLAIFTLAEEYLCAHPDVCA